VVAAVAIVGRTTLGRLRQRTKLLLGAVAAVIAVVCGGVAAAVAAGV
jgi:hypothetical protein